MHINLYKTMLSLALLGAASVPSASVASSSGDVQIQSQGEIAKESSLFLLLPIYIHLWLVTCVPPDVGNLSNIPQETTDKLLYQIADRQKTIGTLRLICRQADLDICKFLNEPQHSNEIIKLCRFFAALIKSPSIWERGSYDSNNIIGNEGVVLHTSHFCALKIEIADQICAKLEDLLQNFPARFSVKIAYYIFAIITLPPQRQL